MISFKGLLSKSLIGVLFVLVVFSFVVEVASAIHYVVSVNDRFDGYLYALVFGFVLSPFVFGFAFIVHFFASSFVVRFLNSEITPSGYSISWGGLLCFGVFAWAPLGLFLNKYENNNGFIGFYSSSGKAWEILSGSVSYGYEHLGLSIVFSLFAVMALSVLSKFFLGVIVKKSTSKMILYKTFALVVPYLFIGVVFSMVWAFVFSVDCRFVEDFQEGGLCEGFNLKGGLDLLYFSFSVLMAVDAGDFSPVSKSGKILFLFQTLIGVFYMAGVVGAYIGFVLNARQSSEKKNLSDKEDKVEITVEKILEQSRSEQVPDPDPEMRHSGGTYFPKIVVLSKPKKGP